MTSLRTSTFIAVLLTAHASWAAGKLYYGSRVGMEVTIVGLSGIGTAHAVIRVKHTPQDARKFCVEYSNDRSAACIERTLRETHLNDELVGNCVTGEFVSLYGQKLRFIGENTKQEDGAPRYKILGEDGQPLDGSGASGYGYNLEQFEALCPGRALGLD